MTARVIHGPWQRPAHHLGNHMPLAAWEVAEIPRKPTPIGHIIASGLVAPVLCVAALLIEHSFH